MDPVKATLLADKADVFCTDTAGAYTFVDTGEGGPFICFVCPCGCGCVTSLLIGAQPNAWHWDGSLDAPTLSPNIRQLRGCYFHGHLTKGEWTFASDSGRKPKREE